MDELSSCSLCRNVFHNTTLDIGVYLYPDLGMPQSRRMDNIHMSTIFSKNSALIFYLLSGLMSTLFFEVGDAHWMDSAIDGVRAKVGIAGGDVWTSEFQSSSLTDLDRDRNMSVVGFALAYLMMQLKQKRCGVAVFVHVIDISKRLPLLQHPLSSMQSLEDYQMKCFTTWTEAINSVIQLSG